MAKVIRQMSSCQEATSFLPYSIDNFGNGLLEKSLAMDAIIAGARKNADLMIRLLQSYLEISS